MYRKYVQPPLISTLVASARQQMTNKAMLTAMYNNQIAKHCIQQNKNLVSLLTIHTYPDRWLQHLQSESNHVHQLDLKGSPQVEFQSHGIPPGLEELIQSPARRRQNCEQLHLWKCHWISFSETLYIIGYKHLEEVPTLEHLPRTHVRGGPTPLTSQFTCACSNEHSEAKSVNRALQGWDWKGFRWVLTRLRVKRCSTGS